MPSWIRINGRLESTDVPPPAKPERTKLIGRSEEQHLQMEIQGSDAGLRTGGLLRLDDLWKLYDIGQIKDKLDVICPGHGFTLKGHKIPMLIMWVQNEDLLQNQAFLQRVRSYPRERMSHVPDHWFNGPKRTKRKGKRKSAKKCWTRRKARR